MTCDSRYVGTLLVLLELWEISLELSWNSVEFAFLVRDLFGMSVWTVGNRYFALGKLCLRGRAYSFVLSGCFSRGSFEFLLSDGALFDFWRHE